ncbi:DUF4488 domain-containing protein [Wenyingzhuangia sp. chi5]|uniref:DUF4488 domain-containing protein n=1 Tax=Wenyingzhuangia gilva TaxID=3057677 RepID=A0ABT8VMY5_9FLAO|nr:DUF4488 domain-containing protein [Wenyingzhuangia sp. chi5]MDO3693315.1 DUF4488 domain-containing protein [Wenyingzhuangia sp. chi5]
MKKIFTLFITTCSLIFLICCSSKKNSETDNTHIIESKSMVGFWRQTGVTSNGKTYDRLTSNYKMINDDGSYFTFITWPKNTSIGHYGSYEITSDSTLTEHIVLHMNPELNGTDQYTRFKLIDKDTLIMDWSLDNERWVCEKWTRIPITKTHEGMVLVKRGTQKKTEILD